MVSESRARARLRRRLSGARRDERGGVTVEFVLWFPFFILLLAVVTDFVFIYMTNSSMWHAAREAARAMSVREADADKAREIIEGTLIRGGVYQVKINLDAKSSEVSALIRLPIAEASVFGVLTPLMDDDIIAAVRMKKEPL